MGGVRYMVSIENFLSSFVLPSATASAQDLFDGLFKR
jgi:hypothetical protein